MERRFLCFFILLLMPFCTLWGQGILFGTPVNDIKVFEKNTPGYTSVLINTDPQDADVYVNGIYEGITPVTIYDRTGYNSITVKKEGFVTREFTVYIEKDKEKTINIILIKEQGELAVSSNVTGAEFFIDGYYSNSGSYILDTGSHTVTCRAFGYIEETRTVYLKPNETQYLRFNLSQAPFEIKKLGISKKIYNPALPGKMGETTISVSVTAPGNISIVILNDSDHVVFKTPVELLTWDNKIVWDGKNDPDFILSSGKYKISAINNEDNTELASLDFFIDRNISYEIITSTKGLKGLENSIDASVSYAGSGVTSLYGQFNGSLDSDYSGNIGISTSFQFFSNFIGGIFFESNFLQNKTVGFTTGISGLGNLTKKPVETGIFGSFSYYHGERAPSPAFYSNKINAGISGGFVIGIPFYNLKLNISPTLVWGVEPGFFTNPEFVSIYPLSLSWYLKNFIIRAWEDFQIQHNQEIFSWKTKTGISMEYFFPDTGVLLDCKFFYNINNLNKSEIGVTGGVSLMY